jgi:hypothetical protein
MAHSHQVIGMGLCVHLSLITYQLLGNMVIQQINSLHALAGRSGFCKMLLAKRNDIVQQLDD